jgi:hypothetical protein
MKVSKGIIGALGLTLALFSLNANALFFFFIPGSVIRKIGDSLNGAEGDNCVSAKAKVGEVITSPTGNTAIVKSLSGTSSICKNPALPIRAMLQFNYSFSSKAGIDLPEGFEPKDILPIQTFNGLLLNAHDKAKSIGVSISARPRKPGSSGGVLAKNISTILLGVVKDGTLSNEEELTLGGLHAYRFRMVGTNKGMFGRSYTYVVTVLEGKDELVEINANCPTSDFDKYQGLLDHFALDIKGINEAAPVSSSEVEQAASAVAQ